jgi:hypothetical protein
LDDVLFYSLSFFSAGGDEGADSDCEIITRHVRQEHYQIGPLGLVNISKANAGDE